MKKWIWVLSLVAVVALTGCIKMEQDITLNKDGSGNVKFVYGMSEQTIKQMEAMKEMSRPRINVRVILRPSIILHTPVWVSGSVRVRVLTLFSAIITFPGSFGEPYTLIPCYFFAFYHFHRT